MSDCEHLCMEINSVAEWAKCLSCGATGPVSRHTAEVFWGETWTHAPWQAEMVKQCDEEKVRREKAVGKGAKT